MSLNADTTTGGRSDGHRVLKAAILVAALAGAFALQACNTTEGLGKDIKSTGAGLEEAASDAKD